MNTYRNPSLLFTITTVIILIFQNLLAQKLIKFDNTSISFDKRWEEAINKIDNESVWIGYSIKRLMSEHSYIGNSNADESRPSLQDVIDGKVDIRSTIGRGEEDRHFYWNDEESIEKVLKDIGILIQVNKDKTISSVKLNSLSLPFDLNGISLYWLGEAKYDESVALLKKLFGKVNDTEIKEDLITAVGIHENSSTGYGFLEDIIFSKEDNDVREQAVFWIAQHDNSKVLELMKKVANEDNSEDVREKAIFGLYMINTDESTDEIIELARNSKWMHIRKQAIFWLGQTASKKAISVLNDAVYDDEETEIQNQAVFALSQLKKDESIPSLIKVAKTHPNPEVRKKAIFWLGQTEDDRALDAIISFLKD
ncbi:MAG: HEAT repeat domain-containing protein [Calditrichaceae bacterium]|nr:HEAT repeat domain-containing protein [Calditrichaceae bacterium]